MQPSDDQVQGGMALCKERKKAFSENKNSIKNRIPSLSNGKYFPSYFLDGFIRI